MEERATIHIHFADAQSPVGAQEEAIPKHPILFFIKRLLCQVHEIGKILLVFPSPCAAAVRSGVDFKRHLAQILLLLDAVPEAVVADPENRAEYAFAGN
jgi:hypothetical protein